MSQFSIEVYDRDLNFKGFSEVIEYSVNFDYLTLEKSEVKVIKGSSSFRKGDFIRLMKVGSSKSIIDGCIIAVTEQKHYITYEFKHLLSLLDVDVSFNRDDSKTKTLERFTADIIENIYKNNDDDLQNIPVDVNIKSAGIFNSALNLKDNIHNLYEIIIKSFDKYNIIIESYINIANKKIIFEIDEINSSKLNLEMNLPNILDSYFMLKDNQDSINKITLVNKDNEEQQVTYYLLDDNSITEDKNHVNRITHVNFTYEYIQSSDDFSEQAHQSAVDRLKKVKYNNLIEIVTLTNNRIIDVSNLKIGQIFNIITDNQTIESILTGYETISESKIKLIFGKLRIDLTKILKLERR